MQLIANIVSKLLRQKFVKDFFQIVSLIFKEFRYQYSLFINIITRYTKN